MSESKKWNSLLCRLCEAIIYKARSITGILKKVGQEVEGGKPRSWCGKEKEVKLPLKILCLCTASFQDITCVWLINGRVLEVVLHCGFDLCIQNHSCAER